MGTQDKDPLTYLGLPGRSSQKMMFEVGLVGRMRVQGKRNKIPLREGYAEDRGQH